MTVYLGIDWSENEHEVVWLNERGTIIAHFTMKHKPDELMKVEQVRQELKLQRQECVIGLETAHNLVIDFLWGWGYEQVYVLAPVWSRAIEVALATVAPGTISGIAW